MIESYASLHGKTVMRPNRVMIASPSHRFGF